MSLNICLFPACNIRLSQLTRFKRNLALCVIIGAGNRPGSNILKFLEFIT